MKLNFEEYGAGRPIVLLHAFPLSHSMWKGQIEPIVAENWRMILPDFPGFGNSPLDSGISRMEDLAQAVANLLSELNIEKAVIGGLSMGGYVALNFARLFPEKIRALILADTNAASDTQEKRQSRFDLVKKIEEKDSGVLIQEMLPNLISDSTKVDNPELVKNLENIFKKIDADGAIAALLGMAERRDHIEFLENIKVPTLLIFGEEDKVTNLDAAKTLNRKIANSKLVIIPKSGHYSNLEQPKDFNNALTDFLSKL